MVKPCVQWVPGSAQLMYGRSVSGPSKPMGSQRPCQGSTQRNGVWTPCGDQNSHTGAWPVTVRMGCYCLLQRVAAFRRFSAKMRASLAKVPVMTGTMPSAVWGTGKWSGSVHPCSVARKTALSSPCRRR